MRVEGEINSDKFIQIVDTNLWPVILRHVPDRNYLFQDDIAPVHCYCYGEKRINTMDCSAQSPWPDKNIIDNLFFKIKTKKEQSVYEITTNNYMTTFIQFGPFSIVRLINLYQFLPKRIAVVRRITFIHVSRNLLNNVFLITDTFKIVFP